MKKLLLAILLCILVVCLAPSMVHAQTTAYTGTPYTILSAQTATGPGTVYQLQPQVYSYTWTLTTAGTVTTASINLEGSTDNVHWYALDVASTSDTNWASGEMRHIVNKPVNYLRGNITALTGGGSITGTLALFH